MSIRKSLILILSLLLSVTVEAQRAKTVRVKVTGSAVGTDVVQTKRNALYDAKRNAMLEAGVDETVTTMTTIMLGDKQNPTLQSAATEVSMLILDGKVRLVGEPQYETSAHINDNLLSITCHIKADVVMEEQVDETFRIKVEGLRTTYREGEQVEMSITPFSDCWVRIFWFDRATSSAVEGDMLFPDRLHYNDLMLNKERTYNFPAMPGEFVKGNPQKLEAFKQTDQMMETNILFVVALKTPIPYNPDSFSYEKFIDWLIEIPANQRFVYWMPIGIVEK
ncbi:MAG: DUF4384 domain-containing protein [Bacteroidales bacterium]|nr:DUF4384 domain-containing protein [Bacteroidales bacterium]